MHVPVILCATDLSPPARDAADAAAAIASALGARLQLVHVTAATSEEARRRLDEETLRVRATWPIAAEALLLAGRPIAQLLRAAAEVRAPLIVVGATGESRSMLRLGGTAERIARDSSVPVLVVRDASPFVRWRDRQGLAIAALVTTDAASARLTGWVRTLRRAAPADVTFLHGYYPDVAAWHFGRPHPSPVAPDPELEELLRRELEHAIGPVEGTGEIAYRVVLGVGRLADHLLAAATDTRADLIAVGHHARGRIARLASIASGVLHLAEASVLVVPSDASPVATAPLPRFDRIVAATDLSTTGNQAVPHAYALAAAGGGTVVLVHVLTKAADEDEVAAIAERLRALVPAEPPRGVATEVEVVAGADPAEAIVETAARVTADAIVVASRGRSGLSRLVLGSVAEEILRRSSRPVLVVRPPPDA